MNDRGRRIFRELYAYAKETKNIWLSLLMAFLLLLGLIIIFSEGSAFLPYIYALF